MEVKSLIFLVGILFLFSLTFVSAEFGYDNPNLPKVTREPPAVITFNNVTGSVNSSVYWNGMNAINTTQMENSGGVLVGILHNFFLP